jgi:hypothetical protein
LSRQALEERWAVLGVGRDTDTGEAGTYARIDAMVEGGDGAVAFLEEKLFDPDLAKKDESEAKRLAAPLADPRPDVRRRAVGDLARFGDHAFLAVQGLGDGPAVPSQIGNVERVLSDCFRYRRTSDTPVRVLLRIGTSRAQRLLQKLADGPQETFEQRSTARSARRALDDFKKLRLADKEMRPE